MHSQGHRFVVRSNSFLPRRNYSMKGKKYIYAHKFEGMPKVTDLQLVEEEITPIKDGGMSHNDINKTLKLYISIIIYLDHLGYQPDR